MKCEKCNLNLSCYKFVGVNLCKTCLDMILNNQIEEMKKNEK